MGLLFNCAAAAMLGPTWFMAGKVAQRLKLPLITGYLIAGALCGPYALQLLTSEELVGLTLIDHACLRYGATRPSGSALR